MKIKLPFVILIIAFHFISNQPDSLRYLNSTTQLRVLNDNNDDTTDIVSYPTNHLSRSNGRNSIYYNKPFDISNNITGTGNKLRDVAYSSSCFLLKCATSCCEGPLRDIKCGIQKNCDEYLAHIKFWQVFGVVMTVLFVVIFVACCCCTTCSKSSGRKRGVARSKVIAQPVREYVYFIYVF